MARRIDIELTSARPDGTWTWRAAGALKPRGVLDGELLYTGAKAGDVVRADAEFEIEGITVIAVLPPKEKRSEPERLELLGPPHPAAPGVTTTLVSRSGPRRDRDGERGGPRRDRDGERGGPRRPRKEAAPADRTPRSRAEAGGVGDATAPKPPTADRHSGQPKAPRTERPASERQRRTGQRDSQTTRDDKPREAAAPARPAERGRRLNPSNTHRTSVLDSLIPEQRPIAEQVLRGGIPAVRTAIHLEREKATAEGRPAPNAEALLAMAEELLPRLKAAEWRDRAEAAVKASDELSLRDLRSVVAGADIARDEESRQLATALREALEARVEGQRQEWLGSLASSLDEGRVVRALRLSARPPDAATRFPADLAGRLAQAAGEAMGPDTPPDRWAALLEAVLVSPVRRSVKPAGFPQEPGEALLHAARQAAGRVPALAPMLGVKIPPPPGPPRAAKPVSSSRPAPRHDDSAAVIAGPEGSAS